MKSYVDGFVLAVPNKKLNAYRKMSNAAGKVWMEHGAMQYVECVGDNLRAMKGALAFPKMVRPKKWEKIIFSWIMHKSKAHRNKTNAKVMKDKRITSTMDKPMPFDLKRMAYGGFSAIVDK